MSPMNLSSLVSFAGKYGFVLDRIHSIRIKPKMYRFMIHCCILKIYSFLKLLFKDSETKRFIKRLVTLNILLNDEILVSFRKQ